jgi:hypothetical protein
MRIHILLASKMHRACPVLRNEVGRRSSNAECQQKYAEPLAEQLSYCHGATLNTTYARQ